MAGLAQPAGVAVRRAVVCPPLPVRRRFVQRHPEAEADTVNSSEVAVAYSRDLTAAYSDLSIASRLAEIS